MNYKQKYFKELGLCTTDVLYCVICHKVATQLHHVVYKSQGGKDEVNNLAPLCMSCHDGHHCRNNPTTEEIKKLM